MTMKKSFIIVFLIVFSSTAAFAHQPRLVTDQSSSESNPILIEDPEISKAYYGKIEQSSEYYKIVSNGEFFMYLSLQVPDIPNQSKDLKVELEDESGLQLAYFDGSMYRWEKFHEDFGNADYLSGPSTQMNLPSGIYSIKISGPENTKYVLVTGQKEEFPLPEFANSLFLVPKINMEFFGMNFFQSIANMFGFMIILIFGISGFVMLVLTKKLLKVRTKQAY